MFFCFFFLFIFFYFFFFFNDTATTEIYTSVNTLSLHALFRSAASRRARPGNRPCALRSRPHRRSEEHTSELQSLTDISYAVFCLKKKNQKTAKCARCGSKPRSTSSGSTSPTSSSSASPPR